MKAEMVVNHFVAMCYFRRRGNETSGNYKAFRDRHDDLPCLTLFNNRIAWLKPSWGDTHDIIETSTCGWDTRTTRKALNWVRQYAERSKSNCQQHDLFDETN